MALDPTQASKCFGFDQGVVHTAASVWQKVPAASCGLRTAHNTLDLASPKHRLSLPVTQVRKCVQGLQMSYVIVLATVCYAEL